MVCVRVEGRLGQDTFWYGWCTRGMLRAPSVALDRAGRPSRDSDPPAPGFLPRAPRLGMARADAVCLVAAVSACVASEGERCRPGPVVRPKRCRHAVPVARPGACRAPLVVSRAVTQ